MFKYPDETDPTQYLYHYTSFETGVAYVLPNLQLRLGPYTATNDPRENKDWVFSLSDTLGTGDKNPVVKNFIQLQKQFSVTIKGSIKMLCFSQDYRPEGICGFFGRGFMHLRMWEQYAGSHKGLCFILEKRQLENDIKRICPETKLHHGPVTYSDCKDGHDIKAFMLDTKSIDENTFEGEIKRKLRKFYPTYFFKKNTDWSAEREYRYIIEDETRDYLYLDISTSLKGAVLGFDFPSNCDALLTKIVPENVPIARLVMSNNSPIVVPFLKK